MISEIEARLNKHPLRRPDITHVEVQTLISAAKLLADIVDTAYTEKSSEDAYYGEDYEFLFDRAKALLEHEEFEVTWDPYGAGYHGPSAVTDEERLQAQAEATADDPFRDYYLDEEREGHGEEPQ